LRRDVLAARASGANPHALPHVFHLYARALAGIAAVYVAGAVLLFGPLIRLFFGARWNGAVELFHYLIPLFALQLVYVPLSQVFLAVDAQRTDFRFQCTCAVALLTALAVGRIGDWSIQHSVLCFSAVGTALMIGGVRLTFAAVNGAAYA
jgi:O-antigen/teichoic acid export membrane protein